MPIGNWLKKCRKAFSEETSLNTEDSFLKNYKKSSSGSNYKTERAWLLTGPSFEKGKMGLIHGYMPVSALKKQASAYGASINEYLVAALFWGIYRESLLGKPAKEPVTSCVPVNLRPFFNSVTTKNFFAVVTAVFYSKKENCSFEEVLESVKTSLRQQLTREHLEDVISYNVSNEKNPILRRCRCG